MTVWPVKGLDLLIGSPYLSYDVICREKRHIRVCVGMSAKLAAKGRHALYGFGMIGNLLPDQKEGGLGTVGFQTVKSRSV